eukprot:Clim_evm8s57 gene=Clim_evmTU8s57
MAVWALCVAVLCPMETQVVLEEFLDRSTYRRLYTAYGYSVTVFALALCFDIVGWVTAMNEEKRAFSQVLMGVYVIALTTCLLHTFNTAPVFMSPYGVPFQPSRILEWIFACPGLIVLMHCLTMPPQDVRWTIAADYLVGILGFLATWLPNPHNYYFLVLTVMAFFKVIFDIWNMFSQAIEATSDRPINKNVLKFLRIQCVVTWSAFPIGWFTAATGKTDLLVTESLYIVADFGAKVLLSLVLVNCNVDQMHQFETNKLTKMSKALNAQLEKSENLLNSMMPASVVKQLTSGGNVDSKEYDEVTVFFSDIAGFTSLSSRTPPAKMISMLNRMWQEYDTIAKGHNMTKIETIGDAFLGVTGCPDRDHKHAQSAANFSLEILAMIREFRTEDGEPIQIRIGLATGSVTGGLVGDVCPHWSIVGDTVTLASKMESTSEPMRIHVSDSTAKFLHEDYNIAPGNPFEFKDRDIKTYFLDGRK